MGTQPRRNRSDEHEIGTDENPRKIIDVRFEVPQITKRTFWTRQELFLLFFNVPDLVGIAASLPEISKT
jgi:hypothetical protein